MPACACVIDREVNGSTAVYRVRGKFESSCAWDLSRRIAQEPLRDLLVDFAQVNDFVDYGIAVLSSCLIETPHKQVRLLGLRQHQVRLFKYFGVEPEQFPETAAAAPEETAPLRRLQGLA
ncbi:MAG TPA: hypothetical protein VGH20_10990 [Myxococcales bacterium]|jgi:hypothetical protein